MAFQHFISNRPHSQRGIDALQSPLCFIVCKCNKPDIGLAMPGHDNLVAIGSRIVRELVFDSRERDMAPDLSFGQIYSHFKQKV